ncbi:MAG TPA: type II toxin-antitoxin system VapC family toxin [Coriobacteriia bacterium]|nr:type II toxin-antitoxin system VapC family toxin [Coriobacteriia bacterium]
MTSEAPIVVVDASVVVKWFLTDDEDGVAEAAELLAEHAASRARLVAPALLAHEVFGVFVRRLPRAEVQGAIDAFFDVDVHLIPADRLLLHDAAELVARRQVAAFDSTYVALAQVLDCELATADRRLARTVGKSARLRVV